MFSVDILRDVLDTRFLFPILVRDMISYARNFHFHEFPLLIEQACTFVPAILLFRLVISYAPVPARESFPPQVRVRFLSFQKNSP